MKLTQYLKEEYIALGVDAEDKVQAIDQLVKLVEKELPEIDKKKLNKLILDREYLSSTGIGSGIAIPHARVEELKAHYIFFARSSHGIHFDSIDDKPVHLIFLILAPENANELHLKMLARVSKFLHDTSFREQLMMAKTNADVYETVLRKDEQY